MADAGTTTTTTTETAAAVIKALPSPQAVATMTVEIFGFHVNMMVIAICLIVAAVIFLFYRIQASEKLDFADLITKDGRAVSLTKVLQLVGGITATWIMIKLTLTGGLTEALFGLYLTYVGAIEGYSKFVAAKYGYNEKSVKDAATEPKPPKE